VTTTYAVFMGIFSVSLWWVLVRPMGSPQ
jgi:hypothetical protein